MSGSVSFDRAAGYYDQTRFVPDEIMARLVPMLAAELPGDGLCLEIGIGTGRIALPLLAAGISIVGVDISTEMLRRLVEKSRPTPPPLVIAGATRLPFSEATFASAIAAHVLHLIPEWEKAVSELRRVLRPAGVIVASRGGRVETEWTQSVRRRFFDEAAAGPWPPGVDLIEDLDLHLRGQGARMSNVPLPVTHVEVSVNELIANLEAGLWSACWSLDEATRKRAGAATREWAGRQLGDLDLPRPAVQSSVWHVYRLPD